MTESVEHIITAGIAAVGAVLSAFAVAKVNQVHALVNSRMTELLVLTRTAAHKEGELEGRDFSQKKTGQE